MLIHLFTIGGHEFKGSQIGLLPGIPQSRLSNPQIGAMSQGCPLVLRLPDGRQIDTTLSQYYINVPTEVADKDELRSLPLIPILPGDLDIETLQVGTNVYLETNSL